MTLVNLTGSFPDAVNRSANSFDHVITAFRRRAKAALSCRGLFVVKAALVAIALRPFGSILTGLPIICVPPALADSDSGTVVVIRGGPTSR